MQLPFHTWLQHAALVSTCPASLSRMTVYAWSPVTPLYTHSLPFSPLATGQDCFEFLNVLLEFLEKEPTIGAATVPDEAAAAVPDQAAAAVPDGASSAMPDKAAAVPDGAGVSDGTGAAAVPKGASCARVCTLRMRLWN